MRDTILLCVFLYGLARAISRPDIGILMWCWVGYMNPHKLTFGFTHDLPFAMVTAIIVIFGYIISREPKKLPINSVTIILFLFILWMFITTCFALDQKDAWVKWDVTWKIQLLNFLMMMIMTTKWRIQAMVWVIALSLAFYGIKGGIFTVLTGGGYHVWGPDGTFIGGNNELGLALIMTIPLLRYLQTSMKKPSYRMALAAGMGLCFISILGTQSRGALVGMAVMTLFLLMKSKNKLVLGLILALSLPVMINFMPEEWSSRMSSIKSYEKDKSANERLQSWRTAINIAKSRVVGSGYQGMSQVNTWLAYYDLDDWDFNPHNAHSIYFEVLAEHGVIGFSLFAALCVNVWLLASKIISLARKNPENEWIGNLAAMIQVSLVGYFASGAFLGLATFDLYYNLIAVLVILFQIVRKSEVDKELKTTDGDPSIQQPVSFVLPVRNK
ncbi:MAG: putative O-glycosylation ligase, exosortase A system-associated [Methylococcaceae bacterium]|nr:putative O-glycosylation ligase, exosortase A system-associated [Methylococcaceae bacterium]